MKTKIAVNEIFGPTQQGEGKNIGMPVVFLRVSGCNQSCVFCDTPYTWDWTGKNGVKYDPKKETHMMGIEDIAVKLHRLGPKNLVVSGGEPMLQQEPLFHLFRLLKSQGWQHIEMETAGSIKPVYFNDIDLFTVSPKLRNSGNPRELSINPAALQELNRTKSIFKFVVNDVLDFDEIDQLVSEYDLNPVYIMPEGIDATAIQTHMQQVAQATLERGYYLTTRLQIMIHGNKRGV